MLKKCPKCGNFSVKKDGKKRGKQQFKCSSCFGYFQERRGKKINYKNHYQEYLLKRRTISDIASKLKISPRSIRRKFDSINYQSIPQHHHAFPNVINLVLDATYFGKKYGFFCFSNGKNIIYFKEIKSEGIQVFRECLEYLESNLGYRFSSFILDGKRGFINTIKKLYPHKPIQMCHFHQKSIIKRYITDNPRSACGGELKALVSQLSIIEPQEFIDGFFALREKYQLFLRQRNDQSNKFRYQALRSAFASVNYHLEYLFAYKEHPELKIPNTTNDLEGKFSHLKERIKIHRGMTKNRKKKAVEFLLKNYEKND